MARRFIIYGRTNCSFCRESISLLSSKGEKHCFLDLTEDLQSLNDTKAYYDWKTVPIILENNTDTGLTNFVGGHTELTALLNSEGEQ